MRWFGTKPSCFGRIVHSSAKGLKLIRALQRYGVDHTSTVWIPMWNNWSHHSKCPSLCSLFRGDSIRRLLNSKVQISKRQQEHGGSNLWAETQITRLSEVLFGLAVFFWKAPHEAKWVSISYPFCSPLSWRSVVFITRISCGMAGEALWSEVVPPVTLYGWCHFHFSTHSFCSQSRRVTSDQMNFNNNNNNFFI